MNVKEYISSGIIESYVLGLASDAERQELEKLCANYPEIARAKEDFEKLLEQQLLKDAPEPPVQLKAQLFSTFDTQVNRIAPVKEKLAPVRTISTWKWIAAASILLLAVTVIWAISINSQKEHLEAANDNLRKQLDYSTIQLTQMRLDAQMLGKPSVKLAALEPMPVAPAASAKIAWDTTTKDVYLMINNLPQPASDKQYQLWALFNKQPVDLGTFEWKQTKLMIKMKGVQSAQAFAITLEPKGGSPTPTGDMYVMGKVD